MKTKNLTFGEAVEALKNGLMVRRSDWYPGHFVFRQVPSTISSEIVPKMQSLPQSVKDEFVRRFKDPAFQIDSISYESQLACVNNSGLIQGYSPCVDDALSENWEILEN